MASIRRPGLRIGRDTVLFLAGLVGIAEETLAQHAERPTLLILFGAMVGLPAFLRADERTKSASEPTEPKPTKEAAP